VAAGLIYRQTHRQTQTQTQTDRQTLVLWTHTLTPCGLPTTMSALAGSLQFPVSTSASHTRTTVVE
jgi:hypothetical protein